MTVRVHILNFPNREDRWRHCEVCGKYAATQATDSIDTGYPDGEILGGRMWPQDQMVQYQGRWYCEPHFKWRFDFQFLDDAKLKVKELDDIE